MWPSSFTVLYVQASAVCAILMSELSDIDKQVDTQMYEDSANPWWVTPVPSYMGSKPLKRTRGYVAHSHQPPPRPITVERYIFHGAWEGPPLTAPLPLQVTHLSLFSSSFWIVGFLTEFYHHPQWLWQGLWMQRMTYEPGCKDSMVWLYFHWTYLYLDVWQICAFSIGNKVINFLALKWVANLCAWPRYAPLVHMTACYEGDRSLCNIRRFMRYVQ